MPIIGFNKLCIHFILNIYKHFRKKKLKLKSITIIDCFILVKYSSKTIFDENDQI